MTRKHTFPTHHFVLQVSGFIFALACVGLMFHYSGSTQSAPIMAHILHTIPNTH